MWLSVCVRVCMRTVHACVRAMFGVCVLFFQWNHCLLLPFFIRLTIYVRHRPFKRIPFNSEWWTPPEIRLVSNEPIVRTIFFSFFLHFFCISLRLIRISYTSWFTRSHTLYQQSGDVCVCVGVPWCTPSVCGTHCNSHMTFKASNKMMVRMCTVAATFRENHMEQQSKPLHMFLCADWTDGSWSDLNKSPWASMCV